MKFLTQAAKVRNEQKKDKRRLAVFLCLAVIVALGTAAALKMYGQAMSHKDKRLICQVEAHQHTDQCYDGDKVICGYADYIVHTHNDDCYDGDGNLVCHLQEAPAHVHTDECYTEEKVLVCKEEEQAHQHTESCYTPEKGELQCQLEEHTHGEECYDSKTGELTCQVEEHKHDDNCYIWEEVLTCPYAAESHQHSDECYAKEKGDLQCQIEEHTHAAECYNENNELICEKEEHTHNDDCYAWNDVLTCQLEETPAGHTHTDACYETKKVLTCGQLELHTHDESCLDENGALVCGLLELKEHTHQAECFETVELTDEEVAAKLEAERLEESFHEEDAGEPEGETDSVSEDVSVSSDETGSVSGDNISGNSVSGDSVSENDADVHVHDESCYDAAGGLMCGYEDVKEPEIIKTYKNDEYIVTAKYNKRANIPEKAELKAELITAESGGEHYAERETEIKRALEDDSVSMNALVKIGFYVDDVEVEPENDVIITVQFLDEKGMKDGSPIAIVHFAEGGSEVINGGKAKDRSTTFKTRRFSEFGIVEGYEVKEEGRKEKKAEEKQYEDKIVEVSESCEYNNDMFQATFHIEGKVKLLANLVKTIEEGKTEESEGKETSEASGNTEVVEEEVDTSEASDEEEEESEEVSSGTADEGTDETDTSNENPEEDISEDETIESEEEAEGAEDEASTPENGSEDDGVSADKDDVSSGEKLEFQVEPIDENTEEYAEDYSTMMAYMDEIGIMEDQIMHQVVAYTLTCNDVKLDLSDCKVTAEINPSRSLKKTAENTEEKTSNDGEEENEVTLSVIQAVSDPEKTGSTDKTTEEDPSADTSEKIGKVIAAAPVNELAAPMMVNLVTEDTSGTTAVAANSQANPEFTVEYYANIDEIVLADPENKPLEELSIINTSGNALPVNEQPSIPNKVITLDAEKRVKKTTPELKEIYSPDSYNYVEAPGLAYFDKIAKNESYKLTNIRTKEKNASEYVDHFLTEKREWHFTNKKETADKNPNDFILIKAGMTVQLIHEVVTKEVKAGTDFYDYDISDGETYEYKYSDKDKKYKHSVIDRETATTHDNGDVWYMYTGKQGINGNLTDQTFGFGNSEGTAKTGLGDVEGNLANDKNAKNGGGSATFGMVTELSKDGKIQYNTNVKAPDLFNEGTADVKGKTIYGGNLVFEQKGDTYTLTGTEVNDGGSVSSLSGLDQFWTRENWNHTRLVASNSFYPLDEVQSAGTKTHDLKFGTTDSTKVLFTLSEKDNDKATKGVAESDDKLNHNHYFGMHYTVEFELVGDYTGPLKYLFYGDDDMWVFLERKEGDKGNLPADKDSQLICDIGGVHSSIGEYVNLRDYLPDGTAGKYKLHFFYTERGASGSTCWMQFTLPSVTFGTPEQETGKLRIQKKVTGTEIDTSQEFGFEVEFNDKNGNPLRDDYSYTKYSINDPETPISTDVLIWDDAKFTLKANEYILVSFLPVGSSYTIKEIGPVTIKNPDREPGADLEWDVSQDNPYIPDITGGTATGTEGEITGTISEENKENPVQIAYNNIKEYELPETGGEGAGMYLMIGAFFIMASAVLVYRKRIIAKRS